MGNTVSAAESVAAGLVHPIGQPHAAKQQHHPYDHTSGVPPPECPMHQKLPPPTNSNDECPVGYGKKDASDINPLNMVRELSQLNLVYIIK